MKRKNNFNPKRRIRQRIDPDHVAWLIDHVSYGGNPEHKRNPGDFGLTPPLLPRADKTLCDTVRIFSRQEAFELLKDGIRKGLFSEKERIAILKTSGL